MRKKHVPQRTCVACRKALPKKSLIRIVRTADHTLQLDETGKAQGRGAYLCRDVKCWQNKNILKPLLVRALRMPISDADWLTLQSALADLSKAA